MAIGLQFWIDIMRSNRFPSFGLVLVVAPLASGCIMMSNNPDYPKEWPQPGEHHSGTCPDLTGIYRNAGELYIEAGINCSRSKGKVAPGAEDGHWHCKLELVPNLLAVETRANNVAISQKVPGAIQLELLDDSDVPIETHTLHQGKHFKCISDGLILSSTRSLYGGAGFTLVGIMTLSGGVLNHSRTFSRDSMGNLVMTAKEWSAVYGIVFGGTHSSTSYVRWQPVVANKPLPAKAP
jgi:hypothetical protein